VTKAGEHAARGGEFSSPVDELGYRGGVPTRMPARPIARSPRRDRRHALFAHLRRIACRKLAALAGLVLLVSLAPRTARAAGDDGIREAVQQIMSEDYPGSLGTAKKKLQEQLVACSKKSCSGAARAEIYVSLGMVASQLGQADDAKSAFKNALSADAGAKLPGSGVTPTIKAQFDEARGSGGGGAMPGGEPSGGGGAGGGPGGDEEPVVGQGGLPAAIKLIKEALVADQEGRLEECIEKDKGALKIEEMPRTRLHLASCESRGGKLVDALKNAQKALELGIQKKDAGVMKVARTRVKELLDRIPHITFVPPASVSDLQVKFDDRPVPTDALTKKFSVDPGKHTVVAEGTVNGFPADFREEYDIKEKETVTVRITLRAAANDFITPGQIKCMLAAKSQEEVEKCLPQNRKSLVIRVAGDLSGYSDTNAVGVYTPALNASIVSPTAGWNVGGNFLVDAVSAASPDIVASASPPFREYRYAGGLTAGYKPGLYGAQVSGSSSSSPDYYSYTGSIRLTADLNEKLVTPSLGYSYSTDRIGRGPNNWQHDFNPLKGKLDTHEVEGGVTFVLSPTSILLVGGTVAFERGDQSQPYRYVAMFDPVLVSPYIPKGAIVDLVNRTRLPVKPLEQLPTERDRFAMGIRYNKRINNATLRLEQRFYYDTWGLKASSTDSRYMVDLSRHLRVWPHLRMHAQSGANFYQLAYSASLAPSTGVVVPTFRTGDRELSPLLTATAGGGMRLGLGNPEGEVKFGLTFVGDVMYTRYFKALYVTARTAVYGSLGFDVEF
jgi:tetratricopeptide (TPR) repeat protein